MYDDDRKLGGRTIKYNKKWNKKRRQQSTFKRISKKHAPFISANKASWKLFSVITFSIMIITMILLPTIIVMLPKATSNDVTDVIEVASFERNEQVMEIPNLPVTIKRTNTGELEQVPLEKYIISVVAAEMPAHFESEALKAQAIAVRTYLVNHLLRHDGEEDFVISDTTEHQVYKNDEELQIAWGNDYHWKIEKIKAAVEATENKVITYHDEPITPTFFSMSNGFTEDAENYWGTALPYLKSVESKWEVELPNFTEQTIFTLNELSEKLNLIVSDQSSIAIQLNRTESNRVSEIIFDGEKFTGRDVREKLGLRSNDFTIQQKNNHFIFTTKGYGHGVGMSQYGANGMAQEGKGYEEILAHYYQDIEINTINEAAPTLVAKHEE